METLDLQYQSFRKKKQMSASKKEELCAYLFILVPVIGFIVFTFSALCFSFYMSFTNYNPIKGLSEASWVGLKNYSDLFTNVAYKDNFIDGVINTILMLASIPIGVFIGLALAVYLKRLAKNRTLLMIIYYLPAVTSSIAIMLVFRDLFRNGDTGLINNIFNIDLDWIADDGWLVKIAIIIKNIWAGIGGTMILYLAGLNNIPESYYEASKIQGASKWQQFVDITLPMAQPTTFYLIVTGIIGGLQSYADSTVFGGGMQGGRTIVYFIWEYGINKSKYGLASAASILLAIVVLLITIVLFKNSAMFKEATK